MNSSELSLTLNGLEFKQLVMGSTQHSPCVLCPLSSTSSLNQKLDRTSRPSDKDKTHDCTHVLHTCTSPKKFRPTNKILSQIHTTVN